MPTRKHKMTSTNYFTQQSAIGGSNKKYGKTISTGGLNLPQCMVTSKVLVKELGAKRTKLYAFQVMPIFQAQDLKLKGDVKVVDENTIEVQAVNRADPSDTNALQIVNGEGMWVESWNKPQAFDVGDIIAVCALKVTCNPRNGGGYWYSRNLDQVTTKARPQRDVLKMIRSTLPKTAFHFVNPRGKDYYNPPSVVMDMAPPPQEMAAQGSFVCPTSEENEKYRLFNQRDGEEDKAVFLCNDRGYHVIQWDSKKTQSHVYVDTALWNNHVARAFGICNLALWEAVGVKFARTMNGVLVGYVKKDKTAEMSENNEYYEKDDATDPDFAVNVGASGYISDPLENVQRAGYEITEAFAQEVLKQVKCKPNAENPWNESTVVNMNETTDPGRVQNAKGVKYYFVCDTDVHVDDHEVLNGLSLEKRTACFAKKKGKVPVHIRWKMGVVYAVVPPRVGEKRSRSGAFSE
jgi:hypothetical protein